MNDDYLFTKQGAPDPEVEALERALAPLRYSGANKFAESAAPVHDPSAKLGSRTRTRARARALVGVALAVAAAALAMIALRKPEAPHANAASFEVVRERGAPQLAGTSFADSGSMGVGSWLETDKDSRAKIQIADIGTVRVAPDSKVKLVRTSANEHRLALERGRIDAVVTAPPRLFVVDTPAGTAVDLGCAYHLTVEPDGSTMLHVDTGQVALEGEGHEAWVPASAQCRTRKGKGPGTPVWTDSPSAFIAALEAYDQKGDNLADVLRLADTPETLSLWHMLRRTPLQDRERIAARIHELVPSIEIRATTLASLDTAEMLKLRIELAEIW
jgi:hypothetical protein